MKCAVDNYLCMMCSVSGAGKSCTHVPTVECQHKVRRKIKALKILLKLVSGPAPERINGRLAMIGFVSALGVELANGQDLFTQISNGGLTLFVGTSVVLTLASLVPLFKGVRAESKSSGLMTSDAELWNGRFAMLGLIALGFTEFVQGTPLV
ncbi:chlorophyll A-B binding protein [Artemisia annua]|uniref:Chlorophyll A-B binding protein n=1 Tax=Artemisia annua TaxID=35608 RepID=A0A2U1P6H6_ARTAN|nr:chlorophyll A-B binding protein [Artemisia annua]